LGCCSLPKSPPCLVLPNPSDNVFPSGFPTQDQVAGAAGWTIGVMKSRKLVNNSEHFAATMGEVSTPAWALQSLASVGFGARWRGMKVADGSLAAMMGSLALVASQSRRPRMSSDHFHSIGKNVGSSPLNTAWRGGAEASVSARAADIEDSALSNPRPSWSGCSTIAYLVITLPGEARGV
jgi:hypothetical protein